MALMRERLVMVDLTITSYTARKFDRRASADVCAQASAKADVAKVSKLLAPAEWIKPLEKVTGLIRNTHRELTLPPLWDGGPRLLPITAHQQYMDKMGGLRAQREKLIAEFVQAWPGIVEDAAARMGSLFRPEDFPSQANLERRYSYAIDFYPIPHSGAFLLDGENALVAEMANQLDTRLAAQEAELKRDLWRRVADAVGHMADKLSDPSAVFRDSLIGNVAELGDLLRHLNWDQDPDLESVRQDLVAKLGGYNPKVLRDEPRQRREAAREAARVMAKVHATGLFPNQAARAVATAVGVDPDTVPVSEATPEPEATPEQVAEAMSAFG